VGREQPWGLPSDPEIRLQDRERGGRARRRRNPRHGGTFRDLGRGRPEGPTRKPKRPRVSVRASVTPREQPSSKGWGLRPSRLWAGNSIVAAPDPAASASERRCSGFLSARGVGVAITRNNHPCSPTRVAGPRRRDTASGRAALQDRRLSGASLRISPLLTLSLPLSGGRARSVKRECLDHFVAVGLRHLDLLVKEHVEHFHRERPHQGLGNRPLQDTGPPRTTGNIRCRKRLGGVLRHYHRIAA